MDRAPDRIFHAASSRAATASAVASADESGSTCIFISAKLAGQAETSQGLEFDLVTEVSSAGKTVWEETSTHLYRISRENTLTKKSKADRPPLERFKYSHVVTAAKSIGRRYGKLSGDFNPIHMHALAAKAFGFPDAITHGM